MDCIKCPRIERLKKEIADLEAGQDMLLCMIQTQYNVREVGGGYFCLEKQLDHGGKTASPDAESEEGHNAINETDARPVPESWRDVKKILFEQFALLAKRAGKADVDGLCQLTATMAELAKLLC